MRFEYFLAQRMRSSFSESTVSARIIKIAVVAIALGIIMILIALGSSLGLQKEIKNKTIALSGDLRIAPFENNNSMLSIRPIDTLELQKQLWEDAAKIKHAYPFIAKGVLLKTKQEFEGAVVKGVSSTFPWEKLQPYLVEGEYPNFGDTISKDIVLSQSLAQKLQLALGDRVTAYFQQENEGSIPRVRYFNLKAIYQTGFPEFDDNFVFADLRHLQRINRWSSSQIGGVELFLTPTVNVDAFAEEVYGVLPPHIDVQTAQQRYQSIFDWIAVFDFNVLIILVIMILVGTLNMATALLVLILERSRMIGVLKSMGASNLQIQKLFLFNAVYIIGHGLLWGNGLGLLLLISQYYFGWLELDPNNYFVTTVPVELPFHLWFGLNALVLTVCCLLLWLPSLIVGRIDPTKVLRFR